MAMDKSTSELITVAGEYKKWALEARKKIYRFKAQAR